jgi:hypothetical protein
MMAETYSVEAILSAYDKGFTKGMKNAEAATDSLGAKLKKGIGFGAFMSIGNSAVNAVTRSFTGMFSEMSSSSTAWQTFEGNMKNFGKANQIPKVKKELQQFAQETIYSSSDMASTYAQMAAVGVKSADKLEWDSVYGRTNGGVFGAGSYIDIYTPKWCRYVLDSEGGEQVGRNAHRSGHAPHRAVYVVR